MKATRLEDICPKCGGTGLLPFVKPDGTASLYAQVFCDCHPVYGENAYVSMPLVTEGRRPGIGSNKLPRKIQRGRMHLYIDDFDFPMSYSVYRSLCQQHSWNDPGPDRPPLREETLEPEPVVISKFVYFKNDIRALELNHRVTELENSNQYLLKKIKDLTAVAKRKPEMYTIK